MAIIFDKKEFKRRYKSIKLGKEKYSLRISLYISLFTALFINGFNYLIFDEKEIKALILKFTFSFIFLFVVYYFVYKSQWKPLVNDYNDSLEYWEKHDPSLFDGEKYEKIE
jgi:hypothetical protein